MTTDTLKMADCLLQREMGRVSPRMTSGRQCSYTCVTEITELDTLHKIRPRI